MCVVQYNCGSYKTRHMRSNFLIDMLRQISPSLFLPTAIYSRAQFDQDRQVFDTTAVRPAFSVNLRIVTPLLLPGMVSGCFGSRVSLHHQRRQGTRLNRLGRFDSSQRFQFQTLFRYRYRWRKTGHKSHCFFSRCLLMYSATSPIHIFTRFNLSAFSITDTELKLIAAAAMMGESSRPKNGYSTPAATGMPSTL